jgi:poly [ADP-ribose] polymerase
MFGKGVYFADMVTKSANYCFTSRENNTGLMLLCEVALGDYYANLLPEGKKSTKGCGKTAPKEGEMLGDVLVPCGEGAATGIMSVLIILFRLLCCTMNLLYMMWRRSSSDTL